jgi:hypothetical protein
LFGVKRKKTRLFPSTLYWLLQQSRFDLFQRLRRRADSPDDYAAVAAKEMRDFIVGKKAHLGTNFPKHPKGNMVVFWFHALKRFIGFPHAPLTPKLPCVNGAIQGAIQSAQVGHDGERMRECTPLNTGKSIGFCLIATMRGEGARRDLQKLISCGPTKC